MDEAVRARITGHVQGVGFRAWLVEQASLRGLRGWVSNHGDGSVEALLIGPAEQVAAMVENCHVGPSAAEVRAVELEDAQDDGSQGFRHAGTR